MGIGIFDRLGFPASMANNTIDFSQNTQNSLNNMPQILATWQMEDIANNTTNGYYQNPVESYTNAIITNLQYILANSIIGGYTTIQTEAENSLNSNVANSFIQHTNRLSGVEPVTANTVHLPHYQTCIGLGKALTYIVYQSDGISNNAVLLGNFGSLYTTNTLISLNTTLTADLALIKSPGVLTPSQNAAIILDIQTANNFIANSEIQDVNYYANCNTILADYNSVKGLNHMGDTEKYLVNNLIGTEKLKTRIS